MAQIIRGSMPVLDIVDAAGRAAAIYRHQGWREVGRIHPSWLPDPDHRVLLMAPRTQQPAYRARAVTRAATAYSAIDSRISGRHVDATSHDKKEC